MIDANFHFGKIGEDEVYSQLDRLPTHYRKFRNLCFRSPKNDSFHEIDIVVTCYFGVFPIEVKAWNGFVVGNPDDKRLTVMEKGKPNVSYENPFMQNEYHVSDLHSILKISSYKIRSLIVFSKISRLCKELQEDNRFAFNAKQKIHEFETGVISDAELIRINDSLGVIQSKSMVNRVKMRQLINKRKNQS